MVNGLLHAGDITVGKPIYMRSLARVCMHFTICKTTRTRHCAASVLRRKTGRSSRLNFERLSNNITTFATRAWPLAFAHVSARDVCVRSPAIHDVDSSSRYFSLVTSYNRFVPPRYPFASLPDVAVILYMYITCKI